jgi:hypothetical protein
VGGEVSLTVHTGRVSAAFTELERFSRHGFVRGMCVLNVVRANRVNEGYHAAVCTFAISRDVFY